MSKIASLSRTVTWLSRGTAGAMALAQLALAALPAEAATDLSAYLAKPPTSDWIENGPSENVLSGPFTASSYAAYVEAERWQLDEVEAGLHELEKGRAVAHGDVAKWLRTWGKKRERKAPHA